MPDVTLVQGATQTSTGAYDVVLANPTPRDTDIYLYQAFSSSTAGSADVYVGTATTLIGPAAYVPATPWFGPADTALTFSDSVQRNLTQTEGITDTALSFSDTLVRTRPVALADTALSFSDNVGITTVRVPIQDDAIGWNFTDAFGRTAGPNSWGNNWAINNSNQFSVDGSEAVLGPMLALTGTTRNMVQQPGTGEGIQVRGRIRYDQVPVAQTRLHGVSTKVDALPVTGPQNLYRARLATNTSNSSNLTVSKVVGGTSTTIYNALASVQPATNQWHWLKMESGGGRVRAKVWLDGTLEPAVWEADVADSAVPDGVFAGFTVQYISTGTDTPTFQFDDFSWRLFDQLARQVSGHPVDTALTFSDSLVRTATHNVTDSAIASFSDSVVATQQRTLADTALSFSDFVVTTRQRTLSDSAISFSDSLAVTRQRILVDNALASFTDSVRTSRQRTLTDTALSFSDALVGARAFSITVTDAAISSFSDSVVAARLHSFTVMDTLGTVVSSDPMTDTSYGSGTMGADSFGNQWNDNGPAIAITKSGGTAAITLGASGSTQNQRETLLGLSDGNQDATLEFDWPAFGNVSMQADILLRWTSGSFYRVRTNVSSAGAVTLSIAAGSTSLVSTSAGTMSAGQRYWMRGRVGSAGDLYLKYWQDGTSEPSTWNLTTSDSSITGQGSPAFRFSANAGLSSSKTLNVHSWSQTTGVGDSDAVGFRVTQPTKPVYDTVMYGGDPVLYPPAVGSGVTVGIGARTVTHPQNFDLARIQSISSTLGVTSRWAHTLADFTATSTYAGPQGLDPLGVEEQTAIANGMVPICSLGGRLSGVDFPSWTGTHGSGEQGLIDIASGAYDANIFAWATALRSVGGTVMCRLWREPSAGHPWWCAVDPGNYIAAWKRVYTVFRGTAADYAAFNATIPGLVGSPTTAPPISGTPVNATNCLFNWCVGTFSWWNNDGTVGNAQSQLGFYPGNSYVDWLSADGYGNASAIAWDNADFADHFSTGYPPVSPQGQSWYTFATATGKPLYISETGAQPDSAGNLGPGGTPLDTDWINSILAGAEAMPQVRAVVLWIGQNTYPATTGDGATAAAQSAYQSLFAQRYMKATPASDVVTLVRTPAGLTDTALALSESLLVARRRQIADTVLSFSDSVITLRPSTGAPPLLAQII